MPVSSLECFDRCRSSSYREVANKYTALRPDVFVEHCDVNNWQGTLISDCNIWFTLIWRDSCIKEGIILISSRPLHIKLPIRLKVHQAEQPFSRSLTSGSE